MDVLDVFNQAMAIMDELSPTGEARTADTAEYEKRTPAIVSAMVAELKVLLGDASPWLPVESMDEPIPLADTTYALGAMGYGLAAKLLVDENPAAASFFHQKYEEFRILYLRSRPAEVGSITDVYGMRNEHGKFSRWN